MQQNNSATSDLVPTPRYRVPEYPDSFQVSFEFFAHGSNFYWPNELADSFLLSSWVYELSKSYSLKQLLELKPLGFEHFPHHEITMSEFTHGAQVILERLRGRDDFLEFVDYRVYSIRYCFRENSTERLLGLVRDNVLYVLWWDINHRSYGSPTYLIDSNDCDRLDCSHISGARFSSGAYNT